MKVLFVCLNHYPYSGPCSSLLEKMFHSGNMKSVLEEIHVLALKCRYNERDTEQINGITVHRCFPVSMLPQKDILHLFLKKPMLAISAMAIKTLRFLKESVFRRRTLIKSDLKKAVIKKLMELDAEAYDVIIPVCGLHETVTATMEYFEHRPGKKMVLYQVDPCANNRAFLNELSKQAEKLEKRMYEKASAIITTPVLYRHICETYSEDIINKSQTMEFPNVDPCPVSAPVKEDIEYNCVYAGTIYAVARNPKYTMDIFNLLENAAIKLHFVGADERQIYKYVDKNTVGERFSFHGMLPLEEARKEIEKADVLVNIGNIMTNQVPSKIFEYISACKPIVNICANEDCPSIEYLKKYPLALSVVEGVGTPKEHAEEIEKFVLTHAGQTVDKAFVLEQFKQCTAGFCAKQMVEVFNTVLQKTEKS